MALKAVLDKLDGLPADVAKEYKQSADGKFVLDVAPEGGMALENVTGLRNSLAATRTERDEATEALKPWKALGVDPTKAKEAITKVAEMANWTPEQKVQEQLKAREDQLAAKHKTELDPIRAERDQAIAQMQKMLVTSVATAALAAEKGSVELLLPVIERQTRVRKVGERYVAEVLDEKGNARVSPTPGKDGDMTVGELVLELKKDARYARAFDGSGASGSGAGGGNSTKNKTQQGSKTVKSSDKAAIEANLDAIADGEMGIEADDGE